MKFNYFELFGLIVNLVSALLLAFSTEIIDPTKGRAKVQIFGQDLTITTIKRKRFIAGLLLLGLGSFLQLLGIFCA